MMKLRYILYSFVILLILTSSCSSNKLFEDWFRSSRLNFEFCKSDIYDVSNVRTPVSTKAYTPYRTILRVFVTPNSMYPELYKQNCWYRNTLILKASPQNEFELYSEIYTSPKKQNTSSNKNCLQIGRWYISNDTLHLKGTKRLLIGILKYNVYPRPEILEDNFNISFRLVGNDSIVLCNNGNNNHNNMIAYPKLLRACGYSLQLENSSKQKNDTTLH